MAIYPGLLSYSSKAKGNTVNQQLIENPNRQYAAKVRNWLKPTLSKPRRRQRASLVQDEDPFALLQLKHIGGHSPAGRHTAAGTTVA
jgi:hypothetical protein